MAVNVMLIHDHRTVIAALEAGTDNWRHLCGDEECQWIREVMRQVPALTMIGSGSNEGRFRRLRCQVLGLTVDRFRF